MIVLHFPAETAALIVSGEQTVVTYDDPHFTLPSRTLPFDHLSSLVGQPVGIAQLPEQRQWEATSGEWTFSEAVTPGAIVGLATVAAVVRTEDLKQRDVMHDPEAPEFASGRWAVILTDAAPCEQRCPACMDDPEHDPYLCDVCQNLACPPIPYDHPGPVSEWSPS